MHITPETFIHETKSWLGTQYHHQGRLKRTQNHLGGVDCIGLVIGICTNLGMSEIVTADRTDYSPNPTGGRLAETIGQYLIQIDNARKQPTDILLFKTFKDPQHIGIFMPIARLAKL